MASVWEQWDQIIQSPDADPLDVIAAASTYHRYLAAIEEAAVRAARQRGASWQDIADAAGTRRQSSWERWRAVSRLSAQAPERFGDEILSLQQDLVSEMQAGLHRSGRRRWPGAAGPSTEMDKK